jgi:putative transposase
MARGPRLDTEGALHHVMVRGIERRKIFLSDKDRTDLIERFSAVLPKAGTRVYAWSFLPNHFYEPCSENPRLLNLGMNGILSKRSQVEPGEAEQIPT